MNSVLAIALNTFKEAVRNRVLYVILFFSLIMIGFSGAISQLSISDHERIIKNLGFMAINFFGVAIAVFVGVSLVYNEIEKRTIYTIVSKPIDRWQFLLGKYFGLLMTVYVNVIIMTLFFLIMLHFQVGKGGEDASFFPVFGMSILKGAVNLFYWGGGTEGSSFEATANVMPVIANTLIELSMVTTFAIFFSSFSTPTLSMFFTLLTFIAGRLNKDIVQFYENVKIQALENESSIGASYYLAKAASVVMPNLGEFSKSIEQALYGDPVQIWWKAGLYAILYSGAMLSLAMFIFSRRNFK